PSRGRHTRFARDWSSDVCSSDLSVRQFIELAVNMPEREPHVGQADSSMRWMSASETFSLTASLIASTRSSDRTDPSTRVARPDSMGPPETNTVGMFRRSAACSMPGVLLSQVERHTSPPAQGALTTYSAESELR